MDGKTAAALAVMAIASALGDITLKRGIDQLGPLPLGDPADLLTTGIRFFSNATIWTGILLLAVFFFSFSFALSRADISLVVPCSAASFLITAVLAHLYLGEKIMPSRWVGTALIVIGIALVVRNR